jgi:protein-tyrosine kinase
LDTPWIPAPEAVGIETLVSQPIGELIAKEGSLTTEHIDQIVAHQSRSGLRFGEAAVALGLATREDVLYALAKQFHYPYAPADRQEPRPEVVSAEQPFSKQAESFRAIRGQLMMRVFQDPAEKPALAIISANSGDGKTYFSANLATVLSQLGGRTLLIDADMRGPRQHEVFKVPNSTGLSGLLSGRGNQQAICNVPNLPSLFLLPGGPVPPNPLELIERPNFSVLIRELVNQFDYVIVDTPAGSYGSDASALAMKCGAALCVARHRNSKLLGLQELIVTMSAGSVKLAGVIMNEYR